MNDAALVALDKAKIELLNKSNQTFITTIIFSLRMKWSEQVPTLGVDGISMFINPDYFMRLTPGLRVSALAHEAWHVCFQHITRRGDKDKEAYNWAGDYVINLMNKKAGYEISDTWLCEDKYDGWCTEEVYNDLMKNPPPPPPMGGHALGQDIIEPGSGMGSDGSGAAAATQRIQKQLDGILVKAHVQAKMSGDKSIGNLPGEIARYLDNLVNPKVPWQTLLQNYFSAQAKNDYSFRKPNRRFMPEFYLPSLYSEALKHITFIYDYSCSVTDEELRQYLSEGRYVKTYMKPEKFTVVSFDTQVQSVISFAQDEEMGDVKLKGGGGTNIVPVIDWMLKEKPELTVIFTDGYFRKPDVHPEGEVLWLIYDNPNFSSEFGRIIHFK